MEINLNEDLNIFWQLLNRVFVTKTATIVTDYPLIIETAVSHNFHGGNFYLTTNGRRREVKAIRINDTQIQIAELNGANFDFIEFYEPIDLTPLCFRCWINGIESNQYLLQNNESGIITLFVPHILLPKCEIHDLGQSIIDISISVTDILGKVIHVLSEKVIRKLETNMNWNEAQIVYGLQLPINTLSTELLEMIKKLIDDAVKTAIGGGDLSEYGKLGIDFVIGSTRLGSP